MKPNEEKNENAPEPRAGGNIHTKGPSQRTEDAAPEAESKSNAAAQGAESGERAGGNIHTKSASSKSEQDSK
jgi:hypothetical protein